MNAKQSILALCVIVAVAFAQLPDLDVGGFTWVENQAFDNAGNLFVSDSEQGKLWKISLETSKGGALIYERFLHLSGFGRVNGLAFDAKSNTLYAAVQMSGLTSSDYALISVDPNNTDTWKLVSEMPFMGNGLTYDDSSDLLYTTTEGNFVPGAGHVAVINPFSGITTIVVSDINSADGAQMLRGVLYISLVLEAKIIAYDVQDPYHPVKLCSFVAPSNVRSIDDFTFSSDGHSIYGADYRNGSVVIFDNQCNGVHSTQADSKEARGRVGNEKESVGKRDEMAVLLMTDLLNPTSVYFAPEDSQNFNTTCVFVSEGGGLVPVVKNRHVLQSPFAL